MAPYYRIVTSASVLPLDQSLLERMEKENKEELEKIEERLEEAKKTEGETDIADALRARANYLTRIGDKVRLPCPLPSRYMFGTDVLPALIRQDKAVEAQKLALEKTPGLGSRIDIVLSLIRIGFFFGDHEMITQYLTQAEEYVSKHVIFSQMLTPSADWLRRAETGTGETG